MSSRIFGPKTVTFEISASEISCKSCIEDYLKTKVLQYRVTYVSKRNSWEIITTGDPEEIKAGVRPFMAEKEAECHSQPKENRRKKRTRRQTPQAQPRTRRESSPLPSPLPPPPPPTPQPPSKNPDVLAIH
ncbi:uncharacterized protein NECHADRAFT_87598 [Fusarium vanettenii 77-13-4]|uniref:HMA domain-containing protein n=1 Tax=Fusarium vanettenii (strain ATCC MYA-4622 / CBS 123669 / FGSC 9596 / NRRL 45880 / 77-13-4) TaxID=660122 RepID=C7Z2G9_FUSV7|nr:uncharacterized protein NECHADRAFT_87598 [Fusarium vanettenii 77-13-4]EEU41478.1 predicted protein [Fusarium vanettenii 77-13-4]